MWNKNLRKKNCNFQHRCPNTTGPSASLERKLLWWLTGLLKYFRLFYFILNSICQSWKHSLFGIWVKLGAAVFWIICIQLISNSCSHQSYLQLANERIMLHSFQNVSLRMYIFKDIDVRNIYHLIRNRVVYLSPFLTASTE